LSFVGWVNNSIVLNRLLFIDQTGSTEGSGEGFNNGFTEIALMPPSRTLTANGRVDLKRIQRASRSVSEVLVS
jgi:hypothetical protein